MNIERFHNELAMRLGYERIVKDRMIAISVEESDEPYVTLTLHSGEVIRIKASDTSEAVKFGGSLEEQSQIKKIADAVHQAYLEGTKELSRYN